jgi:uncharacterized membrane protein YoaK (UPF0700 family)
MQYHRRRRTRVVKALRRGDPITPEDWPVAAAAVGVMRKQKAVVLSYPLVLMVCWILAALTQHGIGRWLFAGLALVTGPLLVYFVRVQRRSIRHWEGLSNPGPVLQ